MDDISKLYEEADVLKDELCRQIKDSQRAIEAERAKIQLARTKLSRLPRHPIQRTKKAKPENPGLDLGSMFAQMTADQGVESRALISGKGTLTVTDKDGNDITDQVTQEAKAGSGD